MSTPTNPLNASDLNTSANPPNIAAPAPNVPATANPSFGSTAAETAANLPQPPQQLLPGQTAIPAPPTAPDLSKVGQPNFHGKGGVLSAVLLGALSGMQSGLSAPTSGTGEGGGFSAGARQAADDAARKTELAKQNAQANYLNERQRIQDLTSHNVYIAQQYDLAKRLQMDEEKTKSYIGAQSAEVQEAHARTQQMTQQQSDDNMNLASQLQDSLGKNLMVHVDSSMPNASQVIHQNVPAMVSNGAMPLVWQTPDGKTNVGIITPDGLNMLIPHSEQITLKKFDGTFNPDGTPHTHDVVFQGDGNLTVRQVALANAENNQALSKARTTYLEQQGKIAQTKADLARANDENAQAAQRSSDRESSVRIQAAFDSPDPASAIGKLSAKDKATAMRMAREQGTQAQATLRNNPADADALADLNQSNQIMRFLNPKIAQPKITTSPSAPSEAPAQIQNDQDAVNLFKNTQSAAANRSLVGGVARQVIGLPPSASVPVDAGQFIRQHPNLTPTQQTAIRQYEKQVQTFGNYVPGTTLMKGPDGSVKPILNSQVATAQSRGAVIVQ